MISNRKKEYERISRTPFDLLNYKLVAFETVGCADGIYRVPGDVLLICTDGLTNMMEDNAIHEILLKKTSLEQKAKELVDGANDNGGSDNIAVVLIELVE